VLGRRKLELVEEISALPRRSPERQLAFQAMHNQLDAAALKHPALAHWRDVLEATKMRDREEQTLFDRELFYAVQPRERLEQIITRYEEAFPT
jgi:hypothetical protein